MIEALTYKSMLENYNEKGENDRIVGLIIAHPNSETGKAIIDQLSYFHHRSGENIDCYMVGYGAYWNGCYPDEQQICKIDNVEWSFSSKMYNDFIIKIEKNSKWQYQGETELLLFKFSSGKPDYSKCILLWIDEMLRDNNRLSVPKLFQSIFRTIDESISLSSYSDKEVFNVVETELLRIIKERIFGLFSDTFDKAKYYCVKDYSK